MSGSVCAADSVGVTQDLSNDYFVGSSHVDYLNSGEVQTTVSTTLNGDDVVMHYRNGSRYVVTLVDENNNPLANRTVIISIIGVDYTRFTDENGSASIALNLNVGNYSVKCSFLGDEFYSASSCSNNITILSTIISKDIVKFFRNGTQFEVTVLDKHGNLLTNSEASFNINGIFYTRNTNDKGVAVLNINLIPGTYIITTLNTLTGESKSNYIVVSSISASDIKKYYRNDTQFYAKFVSIYGEVFKNSKVIFNVAGKDYTRTTDENGIAKIDINLMPGTYSIKTTNPNTGESVYNNIEVLSVIVSEDLVKYYANGSDFVVKLLDKQGNYVSNATVMFTINDINYMRNSDENGYASLKINLKPGTYTMYITYGDLLQSNTIQVLTAKTKIISEDSYMFIKNLTTFDVILAYENGEVIKNKSVIFTINDVNYNRVTDENGVAKINIRLIKGDYIVKTSFEEEFYESAYVYNNLYVLDSEAMFKATDYEMEYKSGAYSVILLNSIDRTPLAGKNVTFNIIGVNYTRVTDENGVAKLNINLNPGVYPIAFSYSTVGADDYASGEKTITVNRLQANIVSSDIVLYRNDGAFEARILDKDNNPLTDTAVIFTIIGVSYTKVTDSDGKAGLNINLQPGYYDILTEVDGFYYTGKKVNHVLVNGTKFISQNVIFEYGASDYFPVQIVDAFSNPVSGVEVTFNISDGLEIQHDITDEFGVARAFIENYTPGTYLISFYYVDFGGKIISNLNSFTINNPITVEDIINSSIKVRNYISANGKLPEGIEVGNSVFNPATYLYLVSKALIDVDNNKTGKITYSFIAEPTDTTKCSYMGNLYSYLAVAQSYIDYADANGIAPKSVASDIGEIEYDGLFYALCRAIAFYGENDIMPAYTVIKSVELPEIQGVLNDINTITDLTPYLSATKNCNIYDSDIQALANSLTEGLTTDLEKARAIYNYVRDAVSYSFYYDSHYGATGTLKFKTGNCCDQAHLVVALARAADLPARYKHGTCTFSSATYGHVWAQILVGNTWVVADPTSSRNSFGVVNNWNNYAYSLHGTYAELSF